MSEFSVASLMVNQDKTVSPDTEWDQVLAIFKKTDSLTTWINPSDFDVFEDKWDRGTPFDWTVRFSTSLLTRYYHLSIHPAAGTVLVTPLICFQDYQEQLLTDYKIPGIRKTLSSFLHDFNNHLTVLLPNMEAALMFSTPEAKNHKYLSASMKGMDNLNAYANLVSTLCRAPRAMVRFFPISGLVLEVTKEAETRYPGLKISVVLEDDFQIAFYQEFFKDLLHIFLKNAWENQPEDKVILNFSAFTQPHSHCLPEYDLTRGNYLKLVISQTAPGPDAETRTRMFDPFFTTRSKGKDEGIGLTLARNMMDCANGTLKYIPSSDAGHFQLFFQRAVT